MFQKTGSSASWFWLRTQHGYFSITTKNGQLRKTNFSGGTAPAKWTQITNADGTVSFQVQSGKYKGHFFALDGEERVGLDRANAASMAYDADALSLKYKEPTSALHDAELYINTNTGYFYFGFSELDKHQAEKDRWENPQGIEKLALTPQGWRKEVIDGYERCTLVLESQVTERSAGLK